MGPRDLKVETMKLRYVQVTTDRPIKRTIFVAWISASPTVGLFQHASLIVVNHTLHSAKSIGIKPSRLFPLPLIPCLTDIATSLRWIRA